MPEYLVASEPYLSIKLTAAVSKIDALIIDELDENSSIDDKGCKAGLSPV